jgi:hypothetical protein
MREAIRLTGDDLREAFRLVRAVTIAKEMVRLAALEQQIFEQQIAALYGVPNGWSIRDYLVGFLPPESEDASTD